MIRILFYALLALCVYLARWGATPKRERKPVLDLRHRWIGAEIDHHLRALPGEPGYPEDTTLWVGSGDLTWAQMSAIGNAGQPKPKYRRVSPRRPAA